MTRFTMVALVILLCATARADSDKVDAAVGGALGGAVGAAVGDELGDRKGAIIGSAVGAAVGTAIATEGQDSEGHRHEAKVIHHVDVDAGRHHHPARHCPPGQAKKGRC